MELKQQCTAEFEDKRCTFPEGHGGSHESSIIGPEGAIISWRNEKCLASWRENEHCVLPIDHAGSHRTAKNSVGGSVQWPQGGKWDTPQTLEQWQGWRKDRTTLELGEAAIGLLDKLASDHKSFLKDILKNTLSKRDAEWLLENYDLVGNPGLAMQLKRIAGSDYLVARAPKSRIQELFLYRCDHCGFVKAFSEKLFDKSYYCCCCDGSRRLSYVAIDFAKKIFFTTENR